MGKPRGDVERHGRVFCVLEIEHVYKGEDAGIWVVHSSARREAPVERGWRAKNGLLNSDQLEDLVSFVEDLVNDEIICFAGVQEMLET